VMLGEESYWMLSLFKSTISFNKSIINHHQHIYLDDGEIHLLLAKSRVGSTWEMALKGHSSSKLGQSKPNISKFKKKFFNQQ